MILCLIFYVISFMVVNFENMISKWYLVKFIDRMFFIMCGLGLGIDSFKVL